VHNLSPYAISWGYLKPPSSGYPHPPSLLSTIYPPHFFDPEKLLTIPEEALRAEIRNEKQREKSIYFRFIHISTEPTTTIIYFFILKIYYYSNIGSVDMWISRQIRHLEIRPVILSASFGSLRPSRQILRCAQDDRLGFSHPERDEGEAEIQSSRSG